MIVYATVLSRRSHNQKELVAMIHRTWDLANSAKNDYLIKLRHHLVSFLSSQDC